MALSATQELRRKRHLAEATALMDMAAADGNRPLTADEDARYDGLLKQIDALDRDAAISVLMDSLDQAHGQPSVPRTGQQATGLVRGQSLGAQFLASETFTWLRSTHNKRLGAWTSPASDLRLAATFTEGGASGVQVVIPQYLPDIRVVPDGARGDVGAVQPGPSDVERGHVHERDPLHERGGARRGAGPQTGVHVDVRRGERDAAQHRRIICPSQKKCWKMCRRCAATSTRVSAPA